MAAVTGQAPASTCGWQAAKRDAITDVPGIRVGHWTSRRDATGCTVILCETSTAAAVDVRGGAPGTRETDALAPANVVRRCHAVVFAGGSAFGLAAATGVMRWCRDHDIGFATTAGKVPIVSAAVLFDLATGRAGAFPGDAEGFAAAQSARGGVVAQGSVGAGTGATVAKLLGNAGKLKGGVGTASVAGPRGFIVGALVATNAAGHIFDPDTGALLAGPREPDGRMVPLAEAIDRRQVEMDALAENTTLVCVATNAALDHAAMQRIAFQAHDGMARAIVPCHTFADGDVAFALSMGTVPASADDAIVIGTMAVRAVERAIVKSILLAKPVAGVPAVGSPGASAR